MFLITSPSTHLVPSVSYSSRLHLLPFSSPRLSVTSSTTWPLAFRPASVDTRSFPSAPPRYPFAALARRSSFIFHSFWRAGRFFQLCHPFRAGSSRALSSVSTVIPVHRETPQFLLAFLYHPPGDPGPFVPAISSVVLAPRHTSSSHAGVQSGRRIVALLEHFW